MLTHIRTVTPRFQTRLRQFFDHSLVGDARGAGLIGAVELVANKANKTAFEPSLGVGAYCAAACLDEGLITRANGDVLLFCPPQIITDDEIDDMFDRLSRALDTTEHWLARNGSASA